MAIKGRTTVYNNITSKEKLEKVDKENLELGEDFLAHLKDIDRAPSTIEQYRSDLKIFWCWNLEYNNNEKFVRFKRRQFAKFQGFAMNEWGWSPKRIRRVKSTLSSLSNYIADMLEDEYEDFQPIVRKIESPPDEEVREKSVFTWKQLQPLLDKLVEKKKYQQACWLALAMYGGRRKEETTLFKVSYFTDDCLTNGGALYKTPEKIRTKGRGKRGKMIQVYTLAKPFKPYLDLWLEERARIVDIETDWLFPRCEKINGKVVWYDEPFSTTTIDSYAQTFSRMLGRPMNPHCLRHSFTSELLSNGIPESVVLTIMHWKNLDMVKVYDDRTDDEQLDKYFGAEGIKQVEKKGLEDL